MPAKRVVDDESDDSELMRLIRRLTEKTTMRRPRKTRFAGRKSRRAHAPISIVVADDTDEDEEYEDMIDSSDDEDAIKVDESGKPLSSETKELVELFSSLRGGPDIIRYFNSLAVKEQRKLLKLVKSELGLPVIHRKKGKRHKGVVMPVTGTKPLFVRILEMSSEAPSGLKAEMLRRYFSPGSSPEKNSQWMEIVLRLPYGLYSPRITEEDLVGAQAVLDSVVYGHQEAKHKLISYLAQLVRNQDSQGLILGLRSAPGLGKTSLIEKGVSKILRRPFFSTSLAGSHDSSFLRGFLQTYEGSECGIFPRWLIQGKVSSGIFFLDELDKISSTPHGSEIMNALIQITDPLQNKVYQDRYLGPIATLDLSRCIFVFAYNDRSLINPILRDRITEIELHGFAPEEKLVIARDYMIPSIIKDISFPEGQVPRITDAAIAACIDRYTTESGLRHLKRVLQEIFMELNLRAIMEHTEGMGQEPRIVDVGDIDSLIRSYKPITIERIKKGKVLGRVNGLYVDSSGSSGVLPLEATWIPASKNTSHSMRCTGSLGKVMSESIQVGWSVAWSLLTPEKQEEWICRWYPEKRSRNPSPDGLAGRASGHSTFSDEIISRSAPIQAPPVFDLTTRTPVDSGIGTSGVTKGCLHVHSPDGSSPKDGPSAGVALALLLFSMLMELSIDQSLAFTGEISLCGTIMPVGGIPEKLIGAHRAGCAIVIIPEANIPDLPRHIPGSEDGNMKVITFSDIREVISFVLSH